MKEEIKESEFKIKWIKSDKLLMDKFVIDDLVGNNHIFGYVGARDNENIILQSAKKSLLNLRGGMDKEKSKL
jgi:hypothetical protein